MKTIRIEDVDLNRTFFHFTDKENLESIKMYGLVAKCGDSSLLVNDKSRVCLSQGGKGLLGIKNSFLYTFKHTRICDIPYSFRKYFSIMDFTSEDYPLENQVNEAMIKKYLDEIYFGVDAVLGEDYLKDEMHGFTTSFDIKGIENHDIDVSKLSLVMSSEGFSALDIMRYVYKRLQQVFSDEMIKDMLSDLYDFFVFVDNYEYANQKSR